MNRETFYTFEHKYLFVIQLRFKENHYLNVQTYHFTHRSSCSVSSLCIFSSFSITMTNKWYLLNYPKKKCNKNSRFEILVTSLCNASSTILQILS